MPKYQALQLPYNDRQTLATIILPKAGAWCLFRGHDVKLDWFVLPIKKKNINKNMVKQIGIVIDEKIFINPKLHWDDYIF